MDDKWLSENLKLKQEAVMSQLAAYLSGLDWSPLLISLKTGFVASIISFFLGIYAARKVV